MKRIKAIMLMTTVISSLLMAMVVHGKGTYVTVTKDGIATVYSNSTGTNSYYVAYGGSRTSGTLYVTLQYYDAGTYKDVPGGLTLDSGNSTGSTTAYYPPYKLYRLKLSGLTGRGSGNAQGQD